jgi:hypothetical protein
VTLTLQSWLMYMKSRNAQVSHQVDGSSDEQR